MPQKTVAQTVYELLRLVATWLQQPTIIKVAQDISVRPTKQS
jgi:hypothetical protein